MTERSALQVMGMKRFQSLAEAFGGDLDRWPPSERDAARRLASAQPGRAAGVLGGARRLDRTLDFAPSISPSHGLWARIVRAAPAPRAAGAAWRWMGGLGLTAGLAAAAAAGVAAAVVFAPTLAPPRAGPAPDPVEEAALLLREPTDSGEG